MIVEGMSALSSAELGSTEFVIQLACHEFRIEGATPAAPLFFLGQRIELTTHALSGPQDVGPPRI
jgi:hypothetical protein